MAPGDGAPAESERQSLSGGTLTSSDLGCGIWSLRLSEARVLQRIRAVSLEKGAKGLTAPAIKHKLALRCSLTGSIFMDNVAVSHDALLPHGQGLGAPFGCLNNARYGICES